MINSIISESSKLAQREYKTIHDWVGKVITWKLGQIWYMNKWYILEPENVLENKMHEIIL